MTPITNAVDQIMRDLAVRGLNPSLADRDEAHAKWVGLIVSGVEKIVEAEKNTRTEIDRMKDQRAIIVKDNFEKDQKIQALGRQLSEALTESARLARELATQTPPTKAIPMILTCPSESCGKRHIDEGEFATKLHHTHACQFCGLPWRPAIEPTIGVLFLPGFKNL